MAQKHAASYSTYLWLITKVLDTTEAVFNLKDLPAGLTDWGSNTGQQSVT